MDHEVDLRWDALLNEFEGWGAEIQRIGGKFRLVFPDKSSVHVERLGGVEYVIWAMIPALPGIEAGKAKYRCTTLFEVAAFFEMHRLALGAVAASK